MENSIWGHASYGAVIPLTGKMIGANLVEEALIERALNSQMVIPAGKWLPSGQLFAVDDFVSGQDDTFVNARRYYLSRQLVHSTADLTSSCSFENRDLFRPISRREAIEEIIQAHAKRGSIATCRYSTTSIHGSVSSRSLTGGFCETKDLLPFLKRTLRCQVWSGALAGAFVDLILCSLTMNPREIEPWECAQAGLGGLISGGLGTAFLARLPVRNAWAAFAATSLATGLVHAGLETILESISTFS